MTEPTAAVPASKKREAKAPTASHRAEMVALRGVIAALGALPSDAAGRIGARLGSLGYRPLGIRRRVARRSARRHRAHAGESALRRVLERDALGARHGCRARLRGGAPHAACAA